MFPVACVWFLLYFPLRLLPRDRQPREYLVARHEAVLHWLADRTVDPCERYQ